MCIPTIKKTGEGCTGINSQFLLEKYGPEIIYIKGVDNIVAAAISRLDYDEKINTHNINAHVHNMSLVKLVNGCVTKTTNSKAHQTNNMYCLFGLEEIINFRTLFSSKICFG